jgi:hypothetical protein
MVKFSHSTSGNNLVEFLKKENLNEVETFINTLLENKKIQNLSHPEKKTFDPKDIYQFKKKVSIFILGGGLAGTTLFNSLKKNPYFEVKVINKYPYTENVTRVPFIFSNESIDYLRFKVFLLVI